MSTDPEKTVKKSEKTRQLILDCAEQVFSEKGYYLASLQDIITMARIAKGTIYQYFENKEHLFSTMLQIYADAWERFTSYERPERLGTKPLDQYLYRFLRYRTEKTTRFFGENKHRANIFLRIGSGVNENIESVIIGFEAKILASLVADIEYGKRMGVVDLAADPELTSNAIFGIATRLWYHYIVVRGHSYTELLESGTIDAMTAVFFKVLRNEPPDSFLTNRP